MATDPFDTVRQDLSALRARLARGEIDAPTYSQLRELILADLTLEERAALASGTPSPQAATPAPSSPQPSTPSGLGPSGPSGRGLRTALPSLADLDLRPGTVLLEQWRLVRELGRGGFGAVFEAEELHLRERQAVKVLDPAMVAKDELLARFRREVSLMRKLVHPRIVRVYDYREDPKQLVALISMELVTGGSVKQLLSLARDRKQPIPIPLALEILNQTLEALAEAHGQGVIHRDVTPGNVLLAGGTPEQLLAESKRDPEVKLVDFGIAGLVERSELSQKSRVLGTAAYVAPEVLDPSVEVTPAADVYGAGAVGYELLTRELPIGRFESGRELRGELPEAVDRFLMSLLEKRPEKRPKAEAAAGGLQELREGVEQESERRQAEQRRQPKEEARRRQELARQEAEESARQTRLAGEARAAGEPAWEGAAKARPAVPPLVFSNVDESGSQAARRKVPSPGVWAGIGLALLVLVIAVGWGISSQRAVQDRVRAEAARLEEERQVAVSVERQRAEQAAEQERQRQARLLEEERQKATNTERERITREQEQAKVAEAARLGQERRAAEAAAQRQGEAEAQRQREETTARLEQEQQAAEAAQRQREGEATAQRQREEEARARWYKVSLSATIKMSVGTRILGPGNLASFGVACGLKPKTGKEFCSGAINFRSKYSRTLDSEVCEAQVPAGELLIVGCQLFTVEDGRRVPTSVIQSVDVPRAVSSERRLHIEGSLRGVSMTFQISER